MITDCFSGTAGLLNLEDGPFFADVFQLIWVVAPVAAFYTLWRIFVTNREAELVGLGLNCGSSVHLRGSRSYIPFSIRASYLLVSASTFLMGLTISEAFKFVLQIITRPIC